MRLEHIPSAISELRTLTKHSHIVDGLPLDMGMPLEAELKIFTGNNRLSTLPSALFELQNLSILSVRNNKLTNIPWSIRNLRHLTSLNVSTNKLRHLPFEILELMRDHELTEFLHNANLWPQIPTDLADVATIWQSMSTGRIKCRSKVKQIFRVARSRDVYSQTRLSRTIHQQESSSRSPPKLAELILRQLSKFQAPFEKPEPDRFSTLMPPDTSPNVLSLLSRLHESHASGQRQCTFCRHAMITPCETWIEWWCHLSTNDPNLHTLYNRTYDEDSFRDVLNRLCENTIAPFERSWCGSCIVPDGFWDDLDKNGRRILYTIADIGAGKLMDETNLVA